jgi:hypothetical protein
LLSCENAVQMDKHSRISLTRQQWESRFLAKLMLVGFVYVWLCPAGGNTTQDAWSSRPDAMMCQPRVETAGDSASKASRKRHHSEARCYMEILGYGCPTPGIKSIKLNCHNPFEPHSKVVVGVPSASLSSPLFRNNITAAVDQQLAAYGQGIQVAPREAPLPCQTAAEATIAKSDTVSIYGLLYFCQGSIRFVQPVVQDVCLPYSIGARVQEDTAIVVVAGDASAVFQQAVVRGNDASSAIAVLGTGEVEVRASTFQGNRGNPGSGLFVRDNATLRIHSSTFKENLSSDYGGGWAVRAAVALTLLSRLTSLRAAVIMMPDFKGVTAQHIAPPFNSI